MKEYYFGMPVPGNPVLDRAEKMAVPVGHTCDYCEDQLVSEDSGYALALADGKPKLIAHNACFLVATGIIPVNVEDDDIWPPARAVTRRQRAEEALRSCLKAD